MQDHYDVLGLQSRASSDEVKKAYRALSKVYHPDKAGNVGENEKRDGERRMAALNVAYEIIGSPRQRMKYDLTKEVPAQPHPPRGPSFQQAHRERRDHVHHQQAQPSAGGRTPGVFPTAYQAPPGIFPTEYKAPTGLFPTAPKPRYQTGGKYTQRSRQARRMDPGTYTQHDHGRAAEFVSERASEFTGARMPSPRAGGAYPPPRPPCSKGNPVSGSTATVPPPIRNPTWLQKQMDIAKDWEDAHCKEEPEEKKYEWRKASNSWLDLKERRRQREQSQTAEAA